MTTSEYNDHCLPPKHVGIEHAYRTLTTVNSYSSVVQRRRLAVGNDMVFDDGCNHKRTQTLPTSQSPQQLTRPLTINQWRNPVQHNHLVSPNRTQISWSATSDQQPVHSTATQPNHPVLLLLTARWRLFKFSSTSCVDSSLLCLLPPASSSVRYSPSNVPIYRK